MTANITAESERKETNANPSHCFIVMTQTLIKINIYFARTIQKSNMGSEGPF
jgi:hypothetical protein